MVDDIDDFGDDGSSGSDSDVAIRHAYWYLSHKRLGKLSVGRQSMTTDGSTEVDLGGTNVVTLAGINVGNNLTVGGAAFDGVATGNFEFNRNNAIRYDTASFGGFVASAAFGEDDRWDVALRYAGEMSGFRLAAAIAYGVDTDEEPFFGSSVDERTVLGGSASILHAASGIFVTGTASQRTNELIGGGDAEETYWGLRGGISKNWFGIGKTIPYVEYNAWDNELVENEATVWGVGIIQNVDAAAMELYLSYKNLSLDEAQVGNVNEDAHVILSGARIKF